MSFASQKANSKDFLLICEKISNPQPKTLWRSWYSFDKLVEKKGGSSVEIETGKSLFNKKLIGWSSSDEYKPSAIFEPGHTSSKIFFFDNLFW